MFKNFCSFASRQANQNYLIQKHLWLKQFIKFSIVGGLCFIVDFLSYIVLTRLFFLGPAWANFLSICLSASLNFVWNRNWTFRSYQKNLLVQYVKFWIVVVGGIVVYQLVFVFLLNQIHLFDLISKAVAAALVWILRFIFNKFWSFK